MWLGILSIAFRCNRLLCGSTVRGDDDSSQTQKADELHEEKREPHGSYRVRMDETYVYQRLEDSGD
jgi:hypothetical protein